MSTKKSPTVCIIYLAQKLSEKREGDSMETNNIALIALAYDPITRQ